MINLVKDQIVTIVLSSNIRYQVKIAKVDGQFIRGYYYSQRVGQRVYGQFYIPSIKEIL
jgi:hypothetical protein